MITAKMVSELREKSGAGMMDCKKALVETDGDIENAVKVMSIHASKGLEFPVCFICDTNTKFNTRDTSEDMVIDAKTGVGIRYKEDYVKYDTVQRKAISLMMKNSFISEELRILYVAMTRAKERLIISAGHKDPEAYLESISSKLTGESLSSYVVSNFKTISDWIIACSLLHPSCNEWRKTANCSVKITENENLIPWDFSIIQPSTGEDFIISPKKDEITIVPADVEFLNDVLLRINSVYEKAPLTTMPQKVSASDLAHKDNKFFEKILQKPAFATSNKASGAEIGTAFHKFMEYCDLNEAILNFDREVQKLQASGYLTDYQCEILEKDKIQKFINSPLVTRVINSQEYHREFRFTVKIDAVDFNPEIEMNFAENKIIMQGSVDLLFVENGQVVIVDYKTDKVKDINSLKEIYHKQLELYKKAIEQVLELPVKELYIYSLHLNQHLNIDL